MPWKYSPTKNNQTIRRKFGVSKIAACCLKTVKDLIYPTKWKPMEIG